MSPKWITRHPCWATQLQSVAPQTYIEYVYICIVQSTQSYSPSSLLHDLHSWGFCFSKAATGISWVLACLHNTAKASWHAGFFFYGATGGFQKQEIDFFLCLPRVFLLNSKYPLVSEEGWKQHKKSAGSRRKNAPCCTVDRHTYTWQSWLVLQRGVCREWEELQVWQGAQPVVDTDPQDPRWCLEQPLPHRAGC